MKRALFFLLLLISLFTGAALVAQEAMSPPKEPTAEEKAKAVKKAYEMENFKGGVQAKEQTGDYIKIADNFPERVMGDPAAPVTIIEYASLTCGHCAHFHKEVLPQVVKNYVATGKIKIIYRDFPLNAVALKAAQLAQCMPEDRYFPFIKTLFENLESWSQGDPETNLTQYAKLAGLPPTRVKSCLEDKELMNALVKRRMEAERQFKIAATPSFVINYGQEVVSGITSFEEFEKAVKKYVK